MVIKSSNPEIRPLGRQYPDEVVSGPTPWAVEANIRPLNGELFKYLPKEPKDQVDNHVSNSADHVPSTAGQTLVDLVALPDQSPGNQTTMREQNVSDPIAIIIMDEVTKKPTFWPESCIYKVPGRLCKGYEDFYTPRVVSIGPYHYCNGGSLEGMQAYKFRYLEAFFSRTNLNLDHCLGVVRELEGKARSYYVEPVKLNSDEFVLMLLVDGTFLLELMLRHCNAEFVDDCDRIYGKTREIQDVYRDLLLIENQIPFFVLEALYKELDRTHRRLHLHLPLVELTRGFFMKYLGKFDEFLHYPIDSEVQHFVDFIRWYYLPKCESKSDSKSDNGIIVDVPSVTAMDEAGVKFEEGTKLNALLDMEFTYGSLQIRHFVVDDWTETLFRNLIAFEQCHDHKVKYITQFMFLMGCMIRTPKDADLLVNREIISSRLGNSEDISTIFNNICKGVSLGSPFYYFTLCNNLKAYCRRPWHRWKATLKRDYFNTPWKLVSTIAAFVLLVLTVIQTVCSIISLS
ncbi:UPF0481 protein At3g47200-like [Rosa rugosa]|uniref:UPF0481 protein At3g47200-like n=1 Tax=Rosa rugosa TaxID=74645 RepID=UPI002B4071AE|nr:UPF0481 protein At3g47200-like [Rosa rugosa]